MDKCTHNCNTHSVKCFIGYKQLQQLILMLYFVNRVNKKSAITTLSFSDLAAKILSDHRGFDLKISLKYGGLQIHCRIQY